MSQADATRRARLLALLTELSFRRRKVVLASGRESDFFIDCKQTVLTAEGHALVGALMLEALAELPRPAAASGGASDSATDAAYDAVAGVELGGCPLASAVSLTSFLRGAPLDAVYVRKGAKDHGSKRLLEGDSRLAGLGRPARIVILEDVVTTGGSTLAAAEKLVEAGYQVAGVIALVDREEGGREAIEQAGYAVRALFGRSDFP